MIDSLKVTKIKITLARIIYLFLRTFGLKDKQLAKRNSINYELDLSEGIDLSIYIFGSFQNHIFKNDFLKNISNPSNIFDVGANIGHMSLELAKRFPSSTIHSFEPTAWALTKLRKNLSLNPSITNEFIVNNCFVANKIEDESKLIAYSSWPLNAQNAAKHSVHWGVQKTTDNIPSITLDAYVDKNNIRSLSLIKIDTDGYESIVLEGAKKTLKDLKPIVIFEACLYTLDSDSDFVDLLNFFHNLSYEIYTTNHKKVDSSNFKKFIPKYGTTDLVAVSKSNSN